MSSLVEHSVVVVEHNVVVGVEHNVVVGVAHTEIPGGSVRVHESQKVLSRNGHRLSEFVDVVSDCFLVRGAKKTSFHFWGWEHF